MIERIGLDVVEVARIEEACQNPRFLPKILTPAELAAIKPKNFARIAGRFAAKEAIAKTVSTKLTWQDVEILNDDSGQPHARISNPLFDATTHQIHLSISHERGVAAAVAILERIR